MVNYDRRTFLKVSGSLVGGIAVGSTVTAAESTERFILDTKAVSGGDLEGSDVTVVHDLSEVDLAVVEGTASTVRSLGGDFAPDTTYELDLPVEEAPVAADDAPSPKDEPAFPFQWDKQAQNVPEAHETTQGEGTRVAIIDTGVAGGHPDLDVDEQRSRNFTGDGLGAANPAGGYHGTHVAGIVGASDNETGVVGTAPETELVDCRVFSPNALASFADILAAVVYSATIECDAANLSLGAYPIPRQGIGQFYGKALNRIMTYANSQGTLLVAAAGNDSADLQHDDNVISLPNEGAQGFSVSATGPRGFLWDADGDGAVRDFEAPPESPAFYTNYGTNAVDVAAPGGDADLAAIGTGVPWFYDLVLNTIAVPTYETDDEDTIVGIADVEYTYSWLAGTSMAAPQVAGAVALVKSVAPDMNANDVESLLERTAAVPEEYDKAYYGSGFLNPLAAVEEVA